jgi:uncharacterized protein YndB with AHSA1/START domain
MPLKNQAVPDTKVVIDRDAHAIELTRMVAASREHVFEAWTRPEHVTCWWDPAGHPLAECEIDLRPGGAFRFVNRHSPGAHQFVGVYREIAPPDYLVFEAIGAIGRVILKEIGGKTHLTVRIECASAAQLEQYLKIGIDAGTAKTLDNLVAYVDAMQRMNVKYAGQAVL